MRWFAVATAGFLLAPLGAAASDVSTEALTMLTTVGYLTGAADGCKVAAEESSALASGMALAINGGNYGDRAEALALFNNAKRRGVADAAAGKADCKKIAASIRDYTDALLAEE